MRIVDVLHVETLSSLATIVFLLVFLSTDDCYDQEHNLYQRVASCFPTGKTQALRYFLDFISETLDRVQSMLKYLVYQEVPATDGPVVHPLF